MDFAFLAALGFFGIYLIRGIFAPGFFYNYDLSQHFTESVYVATVLIPEYHQLIGWNPFLYLGWPQGQFNPPASYLIYSILYYSLSWVLSSLTIYKIMLAGFFLLPGFALYFAAKWFGLGRISAFFAGFVVLGTAGGFELGGPLDITYYGMYEFAASVALIPLILAIYHQSFIRRSWSLLIVAAVLVAFDFMLHTLGGVFTIATLVTYTLAELLRLGIPRTNKINRRNLLPKTILKFIIIVLIVGGICSFWVIPALASKSFYASQPDLVGELGNYATTYNDVHLGYIFGEESSPLVTNVFQHGQLSISSMTYSPLQTILNATSPMFYEFLLVLAGIGCIAALAQSKSRFPVIVILVLIGLFLFISLGPKYYESLWHHPIVQMLLLRPARAAAVARTFLALLVGAGIGESYSILNKLSSKMSWKRAPKIALKIVSLAILIFLGVTLIVNSYLLMSQLPLGTTTSNLTVGPDIPQLFSWLKQNVPNSSRVAFEEYANDDQHLFAASPVETGLQEIGSGYEFWWEGADTSSTLETVLSNSYLLYSGQDVYDTLAGLNAEYVVTWGYSSTSLSSFSYPSTNSSQTSNFQNGNHPIAPPNPGIYSETPEAFYQNSGDFHLAYQIGPFYVFQLKNFTPSYVSIIDGKGTAKVTSFQPEKIQIHLNNVTGGSHLLVRISYFTNWVAYSSKGARLTIAPINVSLPLDSATYMSVSLPTSGTYNIMLGYSQTSDDMTGNAISWFSLGVVTFGFVLVETRRDINKFPVAENLALFVKRASKIVRSRVQDESTGASQD